VPRLQSAALVAGSFSSLRLLLLPQQSPLGLGAMLWIVSGYHRYLPIAFIAYLQSPVLFSPEVPCVLLACHMRRGCYWSQCVSSTGTEAAYADLGHFSRPAIRVSAILRSSTCVLFAFHTSCAIRTDLQLADIAVCGHTCALTLVPCVVTVVITQDRSGFADQLSGHLLPSSDTHIPRTDRLVDSLSRPGWVHLLCLHSLW